MTFDASRRASPLPAPTLSGLTGLSLAPGSPGPICPPIHPIAFALAAPACARIPARRGPQRASHTHWPPHAQRQNESTRAGGYVMSRDDLFHTRIATPSASLRFRLRLLSVPVMRAACGRAPPSIPTSSPAFKCAKGPYSIASAVPTGPPARASQALLCLHRVGHHGTLDGQSRDCPVSTYVFSRPWIPSVHHCTYASVPVPVPISPSPPFPFHPHQLPLSRPPPHCPLPASAFCL